MHLIGVEPFDQCETFSLQDKFQSIDFPVPVRDSVVVCVVIDLAFSDKLENTIYKNVEDKRSENGAPRGGGTLKFSVYIGEADFFGVKILNFRNFWGFQKN